MGIEGLTSWIRKKHPSAVSTKNLSCFSGRRVAVDATNVCYEIWSACFRNIVKYTDVISREVDREEVAKKCLDRLFDYVKNFLSLNILPVFVHDGEYPKLKSLYAHKKRGESKEKSRLRLQTLEEEISSLDPAQRKGHYLEEKRKIMCQTCTPEHEMETMKLALFSSGLPCIVALGEAEKLCSQLCYEGLVDAVVSSDSDNLPHGSLMLLTKVMNTGEGLVSEAFSLTELLRSTGLNFAQFVDFCIMAGCDYNDNIPGIGIVRAFDLIKKYKSIENLPEEYCKKKLDRSVLNYEDCRKLFSLTCSKELIEEELNLDIGEVNEDVLRQVGAFWASELRVMLSSLPKFETRNILTQL